MLRTMQTGKELSVWVLNRAQCERVFLPAAGRHDAMAVNGFAGWAECFAATEMPLALMAGNRYGQGITLPYESKTGRTDGKV